MCWTPGNNNMRAVRERNAQLSTYSNQWWVDFHFYKHELDVVQYGESQVRTFCHKVPPRCIERVIRTPTRDICAIRISCAIFVWICRTDTQLRVESGEAIDIAFPAITEGQCVGRIINSPWTHVWASTTSNVWDQISRFYAGEKSRVLQRSQPRTHGSRSSGWSVAW